MHHIGTKIKPPTHKFFNHAFIFNSIDFYQYTVEQESTNNISQRFQMANALLPNSNFPERIFTVFDSPLKDTLYQNSLNKAKLLENEASLNHNLYFFYKYIFKPILFLGCLYFIYCGVTQTWKGKDVHYFNNFLIVIEFPFGHHPRLALITHAISASIFLPLCLIQTTFITYIFPNNNWIHKLIGKITVVSGFMAGLSSWFLSWQALHNTMPFYNLAATFWMLFALMTGIRAKQRDFVSHRRWAVALQHIGLQFFTTRFYVTLLNTIGVGLGRSYWGGVAMAGLTSFLLFYLQINRQDRIFYQSNKMIPLQLPRGWKRHSVVALFVICIAYLGAFLAEFPQSFVASVFPLWFFTQVKVFGLFDMPVVQALTCVLLCIVLFGAYLIPSFFALKLPLERSDDQRKPKVD